MGMGRNVRGMGIRGEGRGGDEETTYGGREREVQDGEWQECGGDGD